MKKCHSCGETKGLKAIQVDCDDFDHHHYCGSASICQSCAYEDMGCCYCEGNIHECIRDAREMGFETYELYNPEHWQAVFRMITVLENWDKFDYKWNPKKILKKIEVANVS